MIRVDDPELMDTEPLSPSEMARTLDFLEFINRRFGGARLVLRKLEAWSARWDPAGEITILDAGTGSADIPVAVAAWARRRGIRVRIQGVELVHATAGVARHRTSGIPGIEIVEGDVFSRLRDGAQADYVIASLFLHHCPAERHVEVLQAFDRAARRGVIVSDVERSREGLTAVWLLVHAMANRIVRHDGPLSVRRGFTVPELEGLAATAGLGYLHASREPWFRLSLAGEKTP